MTALTEGRHSGEFILSESNGNRSREEVTIVSGEDLAAGTVLGKITASGKYAAYDNGASDGTQTAVGVLLDACDASGGDTQATMIARDAEVNGEMLGYLTGADEAAGITDLLAVGIIVR